MYLSYDVFTCIYPSFFANHASESFDFAELFGADAPSVAAAPNEQTFQATFSTSRRSVTVRADQFVLDAAREGIHGAAVTPFLLDRVQRATGGRTVAVNVAVLESNARVGAEVALRMSELR